MASAVHTVDTNIIRNTDPAIEVAAINDTWRIEVGVYVISAQERAIVSAFAGTAIVNSGFIISPLDEAVWLAGPNSRVVNKPTGEIVSNDGVALRHDDQSLVNSGRIMSDFTGVYVGNAATVVSIDNRGLITGFKAILVESALGVSIVNSGELRSNAICIDLETNNLVKIDNLAGGLIRGDSLALQSENTGRVKLDNRGSIVGDIELEAAGELKDVIANSGKIKGDITFGGGNDVFKGASGKSGDLFGESGNDSLQAGAGDNRIEGGTGNDFLGGGTGDDLLIGGISSNTFLGGVGADDMHADLFNSAVDDLARDLFRYTALNQSGVSGNSRDRIVGFTQGDDPDADRIDLSAIDANPSKSGNQKFKLVQNFTSAKGEVKLLESGGNTIVQVDGDNDTAVDMAIVVVGVTGLKGFDFFL